MRLMTGVLVLVAGFAQAAAAADVGQIKTAKGGVFVVRNGQEIYFQTSGQVTWSPNKRVDANGTRNSGSNPARPLPTRSGGALIGRIGERDIFLIGLDIGPYRVRGNGRLYLGVNDDALEDNTGAYYVIVSY